MIFVQDRSNTWDDILAVSHQLFTIKQIQLPRISGAVLTDLLASCPQMERVNSPLITSAMETTHLQGLNQLKNLRLKSGTGPLILDSGLGFLEGSVLSLSHLSLLTVTGLTDSDFDMIGTLVNLEEIELGDCSNAPVTIFKTLSDLAKLERIRLEKGFVSDNVSKLQKNDRLLQLELIDFHVEIGFAAGLAGLSNVRKFLVIPSYKDEVAKINSEIIEGVTAHLGHLDAFYLGITNEWLDAMAVAVGKKQSSKPAAGDLECFPIGREERIENITLPALYRRICRELPNTKVKVLKMSAGATCKQFIRSLDG